MPRHSLALLVIVIVGVGVRFTYTITTGHTQGLDGREGQMAHNIVADGRWFVRNARVERYVVALSLRRDRLIDPASVDYAKINENGQWYPEIAQSIGVGTVMAGLWSITGDERYIQIQLLQGVVDGLTGLLVYWIAVQLFKRRRAGLLAAGLYAVYPPIAWQTINPYNDIWAVDFTIAIVAIYLLIERSSHRWRWLIVCGLCAGVGAYFRPQVLLITPVLALATVAATGRREAFRRAISTTALALLLLVPWTIHNYKTLHAFIPTRTGLWETAWAGLNELPNDFGERFTGETLEADIHRTGMLFETAAADSHSKHYVIQAITQHPLFYLETVAYRVAITTIAANNVRWMHAGAGHAFAYKGGPLAFFIDSPLRVLEYALEPLVFLLAMLAMGLTWRRWKAQHVILLAVVATVLLPYIAINVEGRYIVPANIAYLIWIGLGADLLIERISSHV